MRRIHTTLNIDDDVLNEAKKSAAARRVSIGRVISDWARGELSQDPVTRQKLKRVAD